MKRLRVLMSRGEIVPDRLAGATAVVVDVFLATTTLLTILENGANSVFPFGSLKEAERVREKLDASNVLRGGEQNSERIEGYDLGPFPDEYPPEVVAGKDVVFVTTNGTRAIADAASAERVLLGCLRNAPAVARDLEALETGSIYLICADGRFALDDFFGVATILSHMDTENWRLNDAAWTALDFMQRHRNVAETLRRGRMGRWFAEHRTETFEFVADVGASDLVPEVVGGKLRRVDNIEASGYRYRASAKNLKPDA